MRLKFGFKAIDFATAIYAALLIAVAAAFVWRHVSPIPYWDQWEFIVAAAENKSTVVSLKYLFSAHNEHIIATSKPIYYIDLFVFGGRNIFSVAMIYVTAAAIAFFYTMVAGRGFFDANRQRVALWLAVAACATALVQWENLIWGFQPQFYLVMLGALLTAMLGQRYAEAGGWASLMGLALAIPFSVFSMGNGVLVVVPIVFLLVAYRAWRRAIGPIILLVIFIAVFARIVPGATVIGDPSLRTLENLVLFFLAMIGGPFSSEIPDAVNLGLLATLGFTLWGIVFLLWPWLKRERLDGSNLIFAAFAMYLFATAGAASYARVTIGVGGALAPRYATPMIMIWVTLIVLIFRALALGRTSGRYLSPGLALAIVALATFFNVRGTSRAEVESRFASVQEAAFSVASGVETDAVLAKLYPEPSRIRPALAFLRQRRLSIFADNAIRIPGDVAIGGPDSVKERCTLAYFDEINAMAENALSIRGWIAHPIDKRSPDQILAFAADGALLGLTAPLTNRPDVAVAIRRKGGFRGFALPVNLEHRALSPAGLTVVAVFGGLHAMACKIAPTANLSVFRLFDQLQPASTELDVETSLDGETAKPGLSPVVTTRTPVVGATIHGTFVSGDHSQGRVSFSVPETAHQCKDVVLPILRGPTSQGLGVTVTFPDGVSEQVGLSGATQHIWSYYLIPGSRICKSGSAPLRISMTDASGEWGAWVASARPRRRD